MKLVFWPIQLYVFYIGAALGSFLNVVAGRVPKNQSLLGRSRCGFCKHTLSWLDLFPIFSYLFLKGKCRYCQKKIGLVHPVFEIITGSVVLAWFYKTGFNIDFSAIIILVVMLIALTIALADYYYQIIPDQFLLILIALGIFLNQQNLVELWPGLVLATGFFYLLHSLFKGQAMGYGDVKYVFVMGLLLPLQSLGLAIYLAFLTGGILSAILILAKRKKMKSTISFGPFLSLGLIVSLWYLI